MMGSADETFAVAAVYDGSALEAGIQKNAEAFLKMDQTAKTVFQSISLSDEQAAAKAKQFAEYRSAVAKDEAAIHSASRNKQTDEAIRAAEREAATVARIQAQAEQEYLNVLKQADSATAAMGLSGLQARLAKEQSYHETRLAMYAGNDAAIEQEMRRHTAVMETLQVNGAAKMDLSVMRLTQRFGSMGNQLQGLQMAFMTAGVAMEGTDAKFGQMIGRVGLMTSGLIGMIQTIEMAKTSFVGMGPVLLGVGAGVVALGVAVGFLLEHQKHMTELAADHSWLGDPERFAQVQSALEDYTAAQHSLGDVTKDNTAIYGSFAGMMNNYADATDKAGAATNRLLEITGRTRDELVSLYGDLKVARMAYEGISNSKIIDADFALIKAQLEGEKDGLQKRLDLQNVANAEEITHLRNHYNEIILDDKKSNGERVKAKADLGVLLGIQEGINQANIDKIQNEWAEKQAHKKKPKAPKEWFDGMQSDTEASPGYLSQLDAQAAAYQKFKQETQSIDAQFKELAADADADEFTKKMNLVNREYSAKKAVYDKELIDEANRTGQSEVARARHREKIQMLDALLAQKQNAIERERVKKTQELNSQLTQGLISDSANFLQVVAGHNKALFAISKGLAIAEVIMNTQVAAAKIESQLGVYAALGPEEILYADMAVKIATIAATALQGFERGGFTGAGNSSEIAGLVHKNEYVVNSTTVNNAGGPEGIERMLGGGGGLSIGEIHNHFHGAAPSEDALRRATTSGIMDAYEQQERIRGMRFYRNGTLAG